MDDFKDIVKKIKQRVGGAKAGPSRQKKTESSSQAENQREKFANMKGVRAHGCSHRPESELTSGASIGGKFGRIFPSLAALKVNKEQLIVLAASMLDSNNELSGDSDIPAGYTYLGQFIDHDITLDTSAISEVQVDPASLKNFRTPKLELDNLYGSGPDVDNFLYDDRGRGPKLLLGETDAGRALDVPRMSNGIAVIGDKRNDENLVVSQIQFAWIRFHNAVVDKVVSENPADSGSAIFEKARKIVTWHYQWIVLNDFVARFVRQDVLDDVLQNGRKFYTEQQQAYIPVEFSVAAYRMGHSMVRNQYDWNKNFTAATLAQIFAFSGLSGQILKQSDVWVADWRRMFDIETAVGFTLNKSRKIDPLLADELHGLPGGAGSLPELNLRRGLSLGLPSGQDVASHIGVSTSDRLKTADFNGADGLAAQAQGLDAATPLWYYILKEAQVKEQGLRLGAVGSRIIAEVFVGLLQLDSQSFLSQEPDWQPTLPAAVSGTFTMADMFRFSSNINPLEDG